MDLEQELKETYAARLGALDVSGGDVVTARRTGARMRMRRRLAVAAAAVAVVAVAVGGSLVGTGRVTIGPSGDTGHWRELPAAPLSPRADALGAWTGHEVIVLGGVANECPPNADNCAGPTDAPMRDGAAYDPATNTWRRIADAPVAVGPGDRLVAAGGSVILRHWREKGSDWFEYDPRVNDWTSIAPGMDVGDLPSAYGSKVYAIAGKHVLVFEVDQGRWHSLPADPIRPRLTQRRVTATPYGPVITGYDSSQPQDGTVANPVIADLYDGSSWRRLPDTGILGNDWSWAGDRMVDFDSFAHHGMDPRPGATLGGLLDPATGRSLPLPDSAVETPTDPWSPVAVGPDAWAACWGLVYDVRSGRVWTLPRPDGALDTGTTAAWVGDSLVVFGGADLGAEESLARTTNKAWLWTP